MFYLESFCYTCLGFNDLERLSNKIPNHVYLFNKISIHLPEVNRKPGLLIMCKICCDKIRKNRKFTKRNLENMKLINDYISKLKQNCTESTYTLLTIEVIDMYPKSLHDWKIVNNDVRQIDIKIYQDCSNTSLTDANTDSEKNYLDLSKEKIKQILNDMNIDEGYQNNSYLSKIENINSNLESSLDVLYSSYSETSENLTLDTTTDGEYLENIQTLNETNFDNTDIETIIHSGYSYEINLTTSYDNVHKNITESTINHCDEKLLNRSNSRCNNLVRNDNILLMDNTPAETYCNQSSEIKIKENLVTFENGIDEKTIEENGELENNCVITKEDNITMVIDTKPFECETCKKRFETVVYLKLHKTKVHSNNSNKISKEDLKCSICEKVFKTHSQLVKHVLTHSNERPFLCIICKKGFKTERNRKAHMLYHTELKFACSVCNKKFVTNGILKDHLLTHSDPKFKCSICNRAFTVENYLKKHLKTHNENEKKFQCETCSKRFLYKANYVAHSLTCTLPNVSSSNI